MRFTMLVEMDNAAFDDTPATELVRLLKLAARQVCDGSTADYLFDVNGNRVGDWCID